MKKLLCTGLALAATLLGLQRATAQVTVPNANLETWAARSGVDSPTNWQTSDDYLYQALVAQGIPIRIPTNTVQKSTVAHGGMYAAALITQNVQAINRNFPGILIAGSRLGKSGGGGVPATARPTNFEFYYQYAGPVSDSAAAVAYITKTVNSQVQLLGVTYIYFQATPGSAYVKASLPIIYNPTLAALAPDSARIAFYSGSARNLTAGTTLRIDDVALNNGTLATRADLGVQELVSVSPNPSPSGRFVVSSPGLPELAGAPVQVLDQLGRVVAQQPAASAPTGQRELDLSSLSPGLYLLRLDTRQGVVTRQVAVK